MHRILRIMLITFLMCIIFTQTSFAAPPKLYFNINEIVKDTQDFRNATWGLTTDEVLISEKEYEAIRYFNNTERIYELDYAQCPIIFRYVFNEYERLIGGEYLISPIPYNAQECYSFYRLLVKAYTKSLGEPIYSDVIDENDLRDNLFEDQNYRTNWQTERTNIELIARKAIPESDEDKSEFVVSIVYSTDIEFPAIIPLADEIKITVAARCVYHIKQQLKNPASLQVNSILDADKYSGEPNEALYLVVDYSAQNGFGGYNREKAYFYYHDGEQVLVERDKLLWGGAFDNFGTYIDVDLVMALIP